MGSIQAAVQTMKMKTKHNIIEETPHAHQE